jgi:hypothetical protein
MTDRTLDGSATPYVVASGSVITAQAGDALLLLGAIVNAGTIALVATGTEGAGAPSTASIAALIVGSPTVTLSGGGTVVLTQEGFDVVYAGSAGATLVNAGNTIAGAGNVGIPQTVTFTAGGTADPFTFINAAGGVVDGIGTGYTLTTGGTYIPANELALSAPTLDNAGLLEATGPGGLSLLSGTIDNAGGTILGLGSGNPVDVEADVNGGLIAAQAGGIVYLEGSFAATASSDVIIPPILAGVTLQTTTGGTIFAAYGEDTTLDGTAAPVTITAGSTVTNDGGTLVLTGTIDDLGTLLVGSGALGLAGSIDLRGTLLAVGSTGVINGTTYTAATTVSLLTPSVTLGGGGVWSLNGALVQSSPAAASTLVVAGATIAGGGDLGQAPDYATSGSPLGLDNGPGGVIDGNGTSVFTDPLQIYGGSDTDRNTGLIEATGAGGLLLQTATLDNAGGTLLADGGGITLVSVALLGGTLRSQAGGQFVFAGTDAIAGNGTANTLSFGGATVDIGNSEGLLVGTLDLLGPAITLDGGDTFQLNYQDLLDAGTATSVTNIDDLINYGQVGDGSTAWSLTNAAGGIISDTTVALPGGLTNLGLLEADGHADLTIDGNTIDNAGGTILATDGTTYGAGTVTLGDDVVAGTEISAGVDIQGGTLATGNGGVIALDGNTTFDGSAATLTIAAGATIEDYQLEYLDPSYADVDIPLTLLGTIHLLGAIAEAPYPEGVGPTNKGLLYGSGSVGSYLVNDGTVRAQGGALRLGTVAGSGRLAIDGGSTLLVDSSAETADFQGQAGGLLVVQPGASYTGDFAHLVAGDTIDLLGASIQSAAPIDGGSTLAVTLVGGSTLDYGLANLAAGASFAVEPAFAAPTETYTFSYTGPYSEIGTGAGPGTAVGTGSFSVETGNGTAGLGNVTAFSFSLTQSEQFLSGLSDLDRFAATFGPDETLTSLSLDINGGADETYGEGSDRFQVTSLAPGGASASGDSLDLTTSQGTVTLGAPTEQFSALVVECFAAGTRLATPGGRVAVEQLAAGDAVLTRFRGVQRVSWIGRRTLDCRRHPRPERVWPVRIAAGAFGDHTPARDLFLSPDHAVFAEGVLIPIKYLINGTNVTQRPVDCVTYYHVELLRHDVLLAEDLPAESYLDIGNRARFGGRAAPVAPGAGFAERLREAAGCAPLEVTGPRLQALRARLASASPRRQRAA